MSPLISSPTTPTPPERGPGSSTGSCLVMSHMVGDIQSDTIAALAKTSAENDDTAYTFAPTPGARDRPLLDGSVLVEPAVVRIEQRSPSQGRSTSSGVGEPRFMLV